MNKKIPNPHDRFFRAAMKNHLLAEEFFKANLPPKILEALDLESLRLLETSFIEENLKEERSDVLFECKIQEEKAALYILIEHQSTPAKDLPFRLFKYIFGVMDNYTKEKEVTDHLPLVYPMVFYNGEASPYPYSLDIFDLWKDPLGMMREVFFQPIRLIDVKTFPEEALNQFTWFHAMVKAMRHIRARDMTELLPEILGKAVEILHFPQGEKYIHLLLYYIAEVGEVFDVEAFRAKSAQLSTDLGEQTMTLMQQLLDRGKKEGILEGLKEGLKEGRLEGEAFGLRRGEELGLRRGEELGLRRGQLEGKLEGKRAMLRTQIKRKFMMLPAYAEQCIQNADSDKLDDWIENIFDAKSIDDLLR